MKDGKQVFLIILTILSIYPVWPFAAEVTTATTPAAPPTKTQATGPADSSIPPLANTEKKLSPEAEARKKIIEDLSKQYQQFTNNPIQIEITSSDGKRIISLTGSVNDIKTIYRVIMLARLQPSIEGVIYFNLTINHKPLSTDNTICANIMLQYIAQLYPTLKDVTKMPITVTSYNGLVFLDGMVDNHDILMKAIQIAEKTPSVQRVISRLDIRRISVRMPN